MTIKILAVTLGMLSLAGCKTQQPKMEETSPKTANTVINQSGMVYLKEGQTTFLKDKEMNITFKRVIEDSRCPEGMQCVWAGVLAVEVEIMGTYTRPQTFTLATTNLSEKNLTKTIQFNGYTITIASFSPDKKVNASAEPKILGLKIVKDNMPIKAATTR